MHVKVDDIVELRTGDETKGREGPLRGRVLRVLPQVNKVIVEGANRVYKHVRRSQRHPLSSRRQQGTVLQEVRSWDGTDRAAPSGLRQEVGCSVSA